MPILIPWVSRVLGPKGRIDMVIGILSSFLATIIISLVTLGWRHRSHIAVLVGSLVPGVRVRVSAAALVRIESDGEYVVFHTKRTPSTYGPPGGVYKTRESARPFLDKIQFEPEQQAQDPESAFKDIRGFIPATSLGAFLRWIGSGESRESSAECLKRELHEELGEIGLEQLRRYISDLEFRLVRRVVEPPHKVPGWAHRQFRYMEVHDLIMGVGSASDFVRELRNVNKGSGLLFVSIDDINRGRHGTAILGSQTCYLIRNRKLRQDPPRLTA